MWSNLEQIDSFIFRRLRLSVIVEFSNSCNSSSYLINSTQTLDEMISKGMTVENAKKENYKQEESIELASLKHTDEILN